jgi:hypothetical protein
MLIDYVYDGGSIQGRKCDHIPAVGDHFSLSLDEVRHFKVAERQWFTDFYGNEAVRLFLVDGKSQDDMKRQIAGLPPREDVLKPAAKASRLPEPDLTSSVWGAGSGRNLGG